MENDPSDDTPHPQNLPVPAAEEPPPERCKSYRMRHDGWTADRQNIFIETLAKTRCVRDACRMAGISSTSAYNHRRRSPAFDERWALALRRSETTIGEVAWQRAVEGVEEDVWYYGKVVGKRKKYANDVLRLLYQHDTNGAGRDAAGRFAPANNEVGEGASAGEQVHDGAHPGPQYPDVDEPTTVAGRTIYPKWVSLPPPDPTKPKDTLDEKLKKISDNVKRLGSRSINVRTGQGIDDEIIDVVRRFVEGGRVMLPAKFKWLSPERFEKAKAEFLAKYPDGMPEDEGAERAEEFLRD